MKDESVHKLYYRDQEYEREDWQSNSESEHGILRGVSDKLYSEVESSLEEYRIFISDRSIARDTGDNGNGYEWDRTTYTVRNPRIEEAIIVDDKLVGFGVTSASITSTSAGFDEEDNEEYFYHILEIEGQKSGHIYAGSPNYPETYELTLYTAKEAEEKLKGIKYYNVNK